MEGWRRACTSSRARQCCGTAQAHKQTSYTTGPASSGAVHPRRTMSAKSRGSKSPPKDSASKVAATPQEGAATFQELITEMHVFLCHSHGPWISRLRTLGPAYKAFHECYESIKARCGADGPDAEECLTQLSDIKERLIDSAETALAVVPTIKDAIAIYDDLRSWDILPERENGFELFIYAWAEMPAKALDGFCNFSASESRYGGQLSKPPKVTALSALNPTKPRAEIAQKPELPAGLTTNAVISRLRTEPSTEAHKLPLLYPSTKELNTTIEDCYETYKNHDKAADQIFHDAALSYKKLRAVADSQKPRPNITTLNKLRRLVIDLAQNLLKPVDAMTDYITVFNFLVDCQVIKRLPESDVLVGYAIAKGHNKFIQLYEKLNLSTMSIRHNA